MTNMEIPRIYSAFQDAGYISKLDPSFDTVEGVRFIKEASPINHGIRYQLRKDDRKGLVDWIYKEQISFSSKNGEDTPVLDIVINPYSRRVEEVNDYKNVNLDSSLVLLRRTVKLNVGKDKLVGVCGISSPTIDTQEKRWLSNGHIGTNVILMTDEGEKEDLYQLAVTRANEVLDEFKIGELAGDRLDVTALGYRSL